MSSHVALNEAPGFSSRVAFFRRLRIPYFLCMFQCRVSALRYIVWHGQNVPLKARSRSYCHVNQVVYGYVGPFLAPNVSALIAWLLLYTRLKEIPPVADSFARTESSTSLAGHI